MQLKRLFTPRNLLTIGASAVACVTIVRAVRLFLRNDVTISITELVRLPPSGTGSSSTTTNTRHYSPRRRDDVQVIGKVEVETSLLHSYRFLLRLSANLNFDDGEFESCDESGLTASELQQQRMQPPRSRRVMRGAEASVSRTRGPALYLSNISPMVDLYEVEATSHLCFTPACISDELLLRYRASASASAAGSAPSGPDHGDDASAATGTAEAMQVALRGQYLSNVVAHSCYLQPDDTTANGRRLSFNLEVNHAVHGLKVILKLPNAQCYMLKAYTGGIGRIVQMDPSRPHHYVWDIGSFDESQRPAPPSGEEGVSPARQAYGGSVDDDAGGNAIARAAAAAAKNGRSQTSLLNCHFYLIYREQPNSGGYGGEEDEDEVDSDVEMDAYSRPRRSQKRASSERRTAASPSGTSAKKAKRDERAARKAAQRARQAQDPAFAAQGVSTKMPTAEITYSTTGLASGVTIRKLQVLEDRPNWEPASVLDKVLLQYVPGMANRRLRRFAHYTTWFVQPIVISQI